MTAWPDGFTIGADGGRRALAATRSQWLCEPFSVAATIANADGTGHGWLLVWRDPRTNQHREAILPRSLLHKSTNAIAVALEDIGVRVDPDQFAHNALRSLFSKIEAPTTITRK
jgi:hypothetical protein